MMAFSSEEYYLVEDYLEFLVSEGEELLLFFGLDSYECF